MTAVLIVDDSKLARIVVGKAVAALQPGWKRLEAGNAEEAAKLLQSETVDVLIVDYNMPGKNGLELTEELRKQFPSMPIAVATANVQDEVVSRARAAGATFVSKPITQDGLRDFLSNAASMLRTASA